MDKIILARHKNTQYTVNFEGKKYVWAGSKGDLISRREVSRELYDWLSMFTTTFKAGELVLDKKNENIEELKTNILEVEEYEANALSRADIKKLLEGNFKKMEAELNKIENDSTKRFVLEVARECKIESAAKQRFIKEWLGTGVSIEELFPME